MRLRKATHLYHALSLIGITAAFLGGDFLIRSHALTGIILTFIGASWSAAWVMKLPRTRLWNLDLTPLIRFWLLFALCSGTLVFLVQKYYDEQNYQLLLRSGLLFPPDDKPRAPWCPPPFRCE
jgi:hypothetical protein